MKYDESTNPNGDLAPREERGKAIANNSGHVKKVNDRSFKVKSQSGGGFYEVKETNSEMTCTCPDFMYRGGKCKHIPLVIG